MQFATRYSACLCLGLICGIAKLQSQTYTFTTLAGSVAGTNDGANETAQFDFPGGVAMDNMGAIFIGDTSNNTIRKVTPVGENWMVSTIAGNPGFGAPGGTNDGVGEQAQFYRPDGIAADGKGNLFVVDHNNATIRELAFTGTNWLVSTIAGFAGSRGYADGTNSDARFWGPIGITIDSAGNLYVGDASSYTIRKIAPMGSDWVVTTIAGQGLNFGFVDGTNGHAKFGAPYGLVVDPNTNIYVADLGNHAIRKIAPFGTNWVVSTIAGNGDIGNSDGTNSKARFNFPADVARDAAGNLYVSDQSNCTIRKVTPFGTNWVVSTIGGVAGVHGANNGVGTNAYFNNPWGLTVDTQGNLFVVDHSNQTIREGVVSISQAPTLRIFGAGTNVLLSWPLSAGDFALESSGEISSGASWTPLTATTAIRGNYFWQTNTISDTRGFFRLHHAIP